MLVRVITTAGLCLDGPDLLQDSIVGDLGQISTLDFSTNTDKLLSDSILAGSIQHLLLHLGRIRSPKQLENTKVLSKAVPDKEKNLVALTFSSNLFILEIIDSIATVVLWEISDELVV